MLTRVPSRAFSRRANRACRPLDTHERKGIFKDKWLEANPDLNEHDINVIEAQGVAIKMSWLEHFRKREEERRAEKLALQAAAVL